MAFHIVRTPLCSPSSKLKAKFWIRPKITNETVSKQSIKLASFNVNE